MLEQSRLYSVCLFWAFKCIIKAHEHAIRVNKKKKKKIKLVRYDRLIFQYVLYCFSSAKCEKPRKNSHFFPGISNNFSRSPLCVPVILYPRSCICSFFICENTGLSSLISDVMNNANRELWWVFKEKILRLKKRN